MQGDLTQNQVITEAKMESSRNKIPHTPTRRPKITQN